MTRAPQEVPGWKTFQTQDDQGITSTHVLPYEQFVHELTPEGSCLCGPDIEYGTNHGRVCPMISHFALDGRYYDGVSRFNDWGEPPEPDNSRR
jgi:hypothetical protein